MHYLSNYLLHLFIFQLYQNFIADFEHRINPLALTEIADYVVNQLKDSEALEFIEKLKEKVGRVIYSHDSNCALWQVKSNDDAFLLCTTMAGKIYLQQNEMKKAKVHQWTKRLKGLKFPA